MSAFIPFALPFIGEEEIEEVVKTLRSGWLTTGPQTRRFEEEFGAYLGRKHSIAVNSATAGLHLALEAVGVREGDVVITTVYTFTASAEVVRYLGATPVFVDIDPRTKNMDIAKLREAVATHGAKVKAIIPVHFAGLSCPMDEIFAIAKTCGAVVVEDAAHALPTTYNGKLIGSFGDITVFSFYATKTLATGEGGMVVTDNAEWATRIKTMRLHGINRDAFDRYSATKPSWYYEVVAPGYKYNLTDVASAIGLHQLRKLVAMRDMRAAIAKTYLAELAALPLELPYAGVGEEHSWHLFTIELKAGAFTIDRNEFIAKLMEKNVGVSVHFIPLHRHPYWRDLSNLTDADFPVATDTYTRTLSLPIYPGMTQAQVAQVIQSVKELCADYAA